MARASLKQRPMNPANAFGFLVLGIVMWALPVAFPAWFPASAIDGSSTRAIWLEVMGVVQAGLGVSFLLAQYASALRRAVPVPRHAEPLGEQVPEFAFVEEPTAADITLAAETAQPVGSITLHGEHAELWRAFNQALRTNGQVRHLASRLAQIVHAEQQMDSAGTAVGEQTVEDNVVPFPWEQQDAAEETEREVVAQDVA